jgi:hypothetical protein
MRSDQERQLTSAWLNIVAAGLVSGGVVTQAAAIAAGGSVALGAAVAIGCLGAGIGLHGAALTWAKPRGGAGRETGPAGRSPPASRTD